MDISANVPSSLKETWNKVSADGKVDKKDYQELLKVAAPNNADKELDNDEIKFLSNLKDQINSGSGELLVKNQGSAQTSISLFDNKVPENMKKEWVKASADGKIDTNEYASLLRAASPTGKDEELDSNEIKFLSNLKEQINAASGEINVKPENPLSEFNAKVPESLKKEWQIATADGKISSEEYKKLVITASPSGNDTEIDQKEFKFLSDLKNEVIKNDDSSAKKSDVGIKNVPQSLKAVWEKISADGKITANDYNTLINAAAPNKKNEEFNEKELEFLVNIKKELEMNKGVIAISK